MNRAQVWLAGLACVVLAAGGCTSSRDGKGNGDAAGGTPAPTAPPDFKPGADGAGDPYFPKYGNGGYDVAGYDLKLKYDPASGLLEGTATVTATATQDLSRFNLDLSRLKASKVTVDGRPATSAELGNELVITPAAGIVRGRPFTVVIAYAGNPLPLTNQALGIGGWQRTEGGAFALGQPESASTWFPVNDHPSDKATFELAMTVPDGVEALSNGAPGPRDTAGGWTTWHWSERSPMVSYLATVVIGQYRITETRHDGKPLVIAVPESMPANGPAERSVRRTAEIADFLATQFGPYPFGAYGAVVIEDERVNYALETQSRPVYGNTFFDDGPNGAVVAHELAHQWFGDSVALSRWADIWLNEGFATYAEWLLLEKDGTRSIVDSFNRAYAAVDWNQPIGDPGANDIFDGAVYRRGGVTVYALRRTIGDEAFDRLIKTWTSEHRDGNADMTEFVAAAETASGKDLESFFRTWLDGTKQPPRP